MKFGLNTKRGKPMSEVTPPDLTLFDRKQGQHWTPDEVLSVYPAYTVEELADPSDLPEEALGELMELCTVSYDNVNPKCPPCLAFVVAERRYQNMIRSLGPDPTGAEDSNLSERVEAIERLRTEFDPKAEVLSRIDLLQEAVVTLFNTGIALGPVTSTELAELVIGAARYIEMQRKVWKSGLALSTVEQEAEIDKLAALVDRLRA